MQDRFDTCICESNWSIDDVLKTNMCYFLLPWNEWCIYDKNGKCKAKSNLYQDKPF